jgi:hypothetical protein
MMPLAGDLYVALLTRPCGFLSSIATERYTEYHGLSPAANEPTWIGVVRRASALVVTPSEGFRDGRQAGSQQDQYRATIMMAMTMNAATSERTRSSLFDPGLAAVSDGGMAYFVGCGSSTNQPTSPDFIGSSAMTIFST